MSSPPGNDPCYVGVVVQVADGVCKMWHSKKLLSPKIEAHPVRVYGHKSTWVDRLEGEESHRWALE